MKRAHVILRDSGRPTRGAGAAAAGQAARGRQRGMEVETEELAPRAAVDLGRKPGILAVAPVFPMKLIAPVQMDVAEPSAAGGATWGVKAVGADRSPFTGEGIVVAVLDTGIDPGHPAFAGVELIRKNFTQGSVDDEHGHGTHCAGTIFGRDVNDLRIGVARGIQRAMIGKVLGEGGGGSDVVAQAILWAVSGGAHVISMSLGIDFPGFVKELMDQGVPAQRATSIALEGYRTNILLFERLAGLIRAQGAFGQASLLVAAAGNESERQLDPDFEIAVSPPAIADGVVSVAALGEGSGGFVVAPFSNTGARISGPGVGVMSARLGGGLTAMNGTSMATPHVAGIAALWAQQLATEDQLNGDLLSVRLVASGVTAPLRPGFDPGDIGSGMVQAPQA
jgi:subtilisin family serine protease